MSNPPSSQGLIPDDLLSNIKKGDCVLFLGADLPLSYPGARPSRPDGDGLDPDYRLDYLGFRLVCVCAIMTLDSGYSGLCAAPRSGLAL